MQNESYIHIHVTLDHDKIPEAISWSANDLAGDKTQEAKAMLLAFFDQETKDTLKIDLWTKEMQVTEMDRFFYQTLRSLADTYKRATSNAPLADAMQQFARYFGEEVSLVKKEE
ncbi:MAG TPA: gliding motility protein GldC [Saprospiraceae bacterium]|nr:gliding motility protein GldC [Saprospiraceae bacterium]